MNRCTSCRQLFTGHVACRHCGADGYEPLNQFAGLVIRGETYRHKEQIRAAGALYDAGRKEWVVPTEITGEQYDSLTAVLNNSELRCGWYDNPADYDSGPCPILSQQ